MAKKILELKQFMKGIVSSPSSTDIPEDAAVFSANIDAISEEGKLKGVKKDLEVSDSSDYLSNLQIFPTTNTGSSATPLSNISTITILNNDVETITTITATEQAYKTYEANDYISNILLSASTIKTAYPIALQDYVNDTEAVYLNVGTTNAVTNNIDDLGESTIPLDATPSSMGLKLGQTIKIEKHDDVNVFEYVRITNIDDTNSEITAIRGQDETDVQAFADNAKVYNKCDYNVSLIQFESFPVDVKITLKQSNGTTDHTSNSVYVPDSLNISPKNFIVTSAKEENSEKTTTNVIFYNQDDVTEQYELKVLENFYSENGSNRLLISNEVEGDWSVGESLNKVSLTSGPNSVYIGTGNQSYSDSKWFGKINHKQFGSEFEGYFLEESRLQAIDENQTIFNIDTMLHPNYASSSNTPTVDRTVTGLLGASSGNRKIFDIKNWAATGANAVANKALLGKQTPSNDLGYVPGAICSSSKITAVMANSTSGASYTPYATTWTHDDYANSDEIAGHLHNETFADNAEDYIKMSYNFITSITSFDTIDVWATRYRDDRNVTQEMKALKLGTFKLKFELTTTAEMNTNLGAGKVITRKPPTGAFISDMYEKNGTLYLLYYRVNGFTHNEEWLYSIDLSQLDSLGNLSGQRIVAKPITPSYPSLKNFGKDYENHGQDWWLPTDVFDGSSIPSRQKVGKDGLYSVYSNKYRWRNTDMLGFLDNGKHCGVQTVVDGITKTSDTDSNWHKNYAEDDADHTSRIMGWSASTNNLNYEDNSYLGNRYDNQTIDHGYSYGFKQDTYRVYPVKKGLTNYRDSIDDIGVTVFLEGSQLTSQIAQRHRMRRLTQGIKKWHKYNIVYNNVTPTFKTWNDYVIMSANPDNHGALQRTAAKGGIHKRNNSVIITDDDGMQWSTSNLVTVSNSYIDGTYADSWASLSLPSLSANESNESINGRILRKKNAFRIGAIYNHNVQVNTATDSEPSNVYERAANRTITTLPATSTSQTGQTDNNLTTNNPSVKHSVVSVSKGEKFSSSTGSGRTIKTNDYIYVTNIRNEESQNNTLLNKWLKNKDLDTYTNIEAKPFTAQTSYSPLRVTNLGNAAFVLGKEGTNASAETFASMYPTTGDIVNGFVKYNNSGAAQTSTSNSTYGNTNSEFLFQNPGSELNVGMDVSFQDAVTTGTDTTVPPDDVIDVYDPGNFMTGTTVYYKISLVYDGYQEGPIQNADKAVPVVGQYNFQTASITLRLSSPPKRVSHIVIYRRNSIEEFYRMVTEVPLEDGWTYNSVDDEYSIIVTDSGILGATYEAVTGMPETLQHTNINYKISTTALGHLVVGDCWHPEIKQGQNFIFKSQPQAYSNFNWSKDYCVLPNKPTSIAWFAGKLFAFDLHNMWRINLDNMVIEDSYEGIGCIGPESILVTDIGMFFCDNQGMYWHNGNMAENISRDILQNSASDDLKGDTLETDYPFKWAPWQKINHQINPHILYDAKEQSVLFAFKNLRAADNSTIEYGAWKFSITRKRWDFLELDSFKSVLTGNKNDIYIGAQDKLLQIGANELSKKPYKWVSKNINMGSATEEKVLTSIKLALNNNAEANNYFTTYKGNLSLSIDNGSLQTIANSGLTISKKGSIITYKPTGVKKFKKLRFEIEGQTFEIDAISIIYRNKSVK